MSDRVLHGFSVIVPTKLAYDTSPEVRRLRAFVATGLGRSYARTRDLFSAWAAVSCAAAARGNSFRTFEVDP